MTGALKGQAPAGRLLEGLSRLLPEDVRLVRAGSRHEDGGGRLTVLVDDRWDTALAGLPPAVDAALPLYGIQGHLVIGPMLKQGQLGCPSCVALRAWTAGRPEGTAGRPALVPLSRRAAPWLPAPVVQLAAAIVTNELARLDAGVDPLTAGALCRVESRSLSVSWFPLVLNVACSSSACRSWAHDPGRVLVDLRRPLPAARPSGARRFTLERFHDAAEEYLDAWAGVVTAPSLAGDSALPAVRVSVPTRWGFNEIAIGHGDTVRDARTAAVLEGLERHAGWHNAGREPAAVASYLELGRSAEAVDPRTLLLHEPEAYEHPGFEYVPFRPDTEIAWARAQVVGTEQDVFVPFHVAYYGASRDPALGPSFVYENSNGCAIGAGPEEALLAGLLEVVERDAFLRMWYSATPLPELDLDGLDDKAALVVRVLAGRTRRDLRAFRAVGEFGLPVVVLVSTSDTPGEPATLITAGCALETNEALLAAVHEMATAGPAITANYRLRREELPPLLEDPGRLRFMTDHALAAALPQASDRFSFLLDPPEPPAAAEPWHVPQGDVAADLAAVLAAAAEQGRRIFAVDHTTPEIARLGMSCVKAIVPGTAPMTFGHLHRRMPCADDLMAFRRRHGALAPLEVRHVPHPFP